MLWPSGFPRASGHRLGALAALAAGSTGQRTSCPTRFRQVPSLSRSSAGRVSKLIGLPFTSPTMAGPLGLPVVPLAAFALAAESKIDKVSKNGVVFMLISR